MKPFWVLGLILSATALLGNPLASAQAKPKASPVGIDSDPRGEQELIACTQNLQNAGSFQDVKARVPSMTESLYRQKLTALAERIAKAGCDVVALQELLGKDEQIARNGMQLLIGELRRKSGRIFDVRVSPEGDTTLRNGFLVALDRSTILQSLAYSRVELPKLLPDEKPRFFERSPFEIQLEVKGRGEAPSKIMTLVTFHFKSRAGAVGDPTGLQYETLRMQMAEALRRVLESRHSGAFKSADELLVVLGDRNANFDLATGRILEGSLALRDFQIDGPCRLSKRGVPLCKTDARRPRALFSVLTDDPQMKGVAGTFVYKQNFSWLDDIALPLPSLRFALTSPYQEGDYASGVISKPSAASDHALVYVKLNW